jgi:thiamine-monophosphate kinase
MTMAGGEDAGVGDSERLLIERIARRFPKSAALIGIGDDAAIVSPEGPIAVTSDMLVEGVDFTAATPIGFVARKSLAANVSDIAAMGAVPGFFTLSLGLPSAWQGDPERFFEALEIAAKEWQIELIGGDLSAAPAIIVAITAIGRLPAGQRPLLRSGARPGDRLYLSRPIGGAAAGLQLLEAGWSVAGDGAVTPPAALRDQAGYAVREFATAAIRRQVDPSPEVRLGALLGRMPEITSCIDLSDGLSTDLQHLCEASLCAAVVDRTRIPLFQELPQLAAALGIDAARAVLHGGEELALLFTSALRESDLSTRLGQPVYAIGRMRVGSGMTLVVDGTETVLEPQGFDHFADQGGNSAS